jgi:uncharacterized protein YecE (DUF72 family)
MRTESKVKTGYAPKALDRWAQAAKAWAAGAEPADVPRLAPAGKPAGPRDVFMYFISGAKERAPAAATGLIERLK